MNTRTPLMDDGPPGATGGRHMASRIVDGIVLLAGWALLALSVAIALEILLRKFLNMSLQGVDEIGGYILALASTVGFTYAMTMHRHICVDLLVKRLPARGLLLAASLAHLLLATFAGTLAWRAALVLRDSWDLKAIAPTPLKTPLVIPQSAWCLALAIFTAYAAWLAVRLLKGALGPSPRVLAASIQVEEDGR